MTSARSSVAAANYFAKKMEAGMKIKNRRAWDRVESMVDRLYVELNYPFDEFQDRNNAYWAKCRLIDAWNTVAWPKPER